jgi:hypothetical protein
MTEVSVLLLKVPRHVDKFRVANLVKQLAAAFPPVRRVEAFNGTDTRDAHIYLSIDPVAGGTAGMTRARAHLAAVDRDMQLIDLQVLRSMPGASAGRPARYMYVIETDVVPVAEKELTDWYNGVHLPGVARVAGNVHTRRLRTPEGSPRYYSCYELENPHTIDGEAWLAVRNMPWSAQVRPMMTNTRRTMFERVCSLTF